MSITVVATVVVGFQGKLDAVKNPKTKYDEDTGKPYQTREHSHTNLVCGETIVADDKSNPDAFCDGESIDGLELFSSGAYQQEHMRWLGKAIAKVQFDPGTTDFECEIPEEVKRFADKYGLTPRSTLILYVG
jgi:hypothetical protein